MWPFQKKHFEWREPKEFRKTAARVEASKSRWWHKPLMGFAIACLLMTNWAMAKLIPNKQPPSFEIASLIAVGGGLFLVYFLSWLHQVLPTSVMVFENRLLRTNGSAHLQWMFKDIRSFMIQDCQTFRILVLTNRTGRQWLVGMPLKVDVPALQSFLNGRGLQQISKGELETPNLAELPLN